MGIKINIKQIILEIEYVLIITFLVTCISDSAMSYLDKYYICLLFTIYHELAHILVATLLNRNLRRVFVGISGMTAYFKYDYNKDRVYYKKELLIFFAGPLANIIIAYIFKDVRFVYEINIFLALLNLLPIYPLDGFNILKSCLKIFNIGKRSVERYIKINSTIFLTILSIISIAIFFKYYNVSGIIFVTYVLLINIKSY